MKLDLVISEGMCVKIQKSWVVKLNCSIRAYYGPKGQGCDKGVERYVYAKKGKNGLSKDIYLINHCILWYFSSKSFKYNFWNCKTHYGVRQSHPASV